MKLDKVYNRYFILNPFTKHFYCFPKSYENDWTKKVHRKLHLLLGFFVAPRKIFHLITSRKCLFLLNIMCFRRIIYFIFNVELKLKLWFEVNVPYYVVIQLKLVVYHLLWQKGYFTDFEIKRTFGIKLN